MKQLITYSLAIIGMIFFVMASLVIAQDDDGNGEAEPTIIEPPEYAGTRECRDCHRSVSGAHGDTAHALTFIEIEEDMEPDENPIIGDFSSGEDIRAAAFPDGDRAFDVPDVAFTLGAGRNMQAYVTQIDETYYVLPARWDVQNQTWVSFDLAESWPDDSYAYGPNCAGCHTVGLDVSDYTWEEEGVMCESCHGPGLDHVEAADDAGGSIDETERAAIYDSINLGYDGATCGQCHSRGLAEDGIHPYPVGFYPGLVTLEDVFTLATDDVHLWATGHAKLPNMQYNEWINSTHPQSLEGAQQSENFEPACMSCHSVTEQLVELRLSNEDIDPATVDPLALAEANPFGVTCVSCHNPHMEAADEDETDEAATALPALLVEDSYAQCVSCHSDSEITPGIHYPVQQVFEGISFIEAIEVEPSAHFTAEDGPTCATCHMPDVATYFGERNSHTFAIIPPGAALDDATLQDSCSGCHEEGPAALQDLIDDIQNDTRQRIETARAAIGENTPEWVITALDVIEGDGSAGIHNYAYTDELLDAVEAELELE